MPIDLSRKREPDHVLIERMANHLVACRAVKHTATVQDMRQRGWSIEQITKFRERAVARAEVIHAADRASGQGGQSGQAA
ncbi:MAG: hypothetical protein P1U37_06710 [Minwuia sp.]|nr:hypothetical protein [Minwuia sp.]